MTASPLDVMKVAEQSVRMAGAYLRLISFEKLEIFKKGPGDIFTNYDIESERLIKNHISMHYPEDVIIAEESSTDLGAVANKVTWYVDPLDGTKAFLRGDFGMVSMSVAAWDNEGLVAGTVYNPFTDIMYSAARGHSVLMNGYPLRKPADPPLDRARVLIDFSGKMPYKIKEHLVLGELTGRVGRPFRIAGGISQHLVLIAQSTLHGGLFWGVGRKGQFWDIAAAILILENLGIKVTNLEGKRLHPSDECFDQMIIGPENLHKEILDWVNDIKKNTEEKQIL